MSGTQTLSRQTVLELLEPIAVRGELPSELSGLAFDSRTVEAGDWFFGLPGVRTDGVRFVPQAIERGAAAIVAERETSDAPTLVVEDARRAMARVAARLYGEPATRMRTVGITGTNGKSTCAWMIRSILEAAGWSVGLVGTLGAYVGDERKETSFTTPESPQLQELLAEMLERGVRSAVLEVSSHALAQCRAYDVPFDVTVFTSFSHDHLDYHGTEEAYLDAKLRLFDGRNGAAGVKRTTAVIHAGDRTAPRFLEAARRGRQEPVTYGLECEADVVGRVLEADESGSRFAVRDGDGDHEAWIRIPGRFNVENALGAWTVASALGVAAVDRRRGLERLEGVPGRLESVDAGQPFAVFVDFAHTPDGLERTLRTLRTIARGRLHCVLGAGGDRDVEKRPRMGRVASLEADRVIFTSDNPRGENPETILAALRSGVARESNAEVVVEVDRRRAIEEAVRGCRPGDVLLIAGKGHEATQTIGDRVVPFDDRAEARAALAAFATRQEEE